MIAIHDHMHMLIERCTGSAGIHMENSTGVEDKIIQLIVMFCFNYLSILDLLFV
jgi:hypothetical protein